MAQDPYKYFRIEAKELLDRLNRGVLDLEKGVVAKAAVPHLLRLAHTFKGAARVVKQIEIADATHAIEEALTPFREIDGPVPRERTDAVLKLLDDIGRRLAAIGSPPATESVRRHAPVSQETLKTLRADVVEFDAMLDGIAEVHAQVGILRRAVVSVEKAGHRVDLLARRRAPTTAVDAAAVDGDFLRGLAAEGGVSDAAHPIVDEIRTIIAALDRNLSTALDRIDRELEQVRDLAEQLRLMPAGTLFTALERTARDAAQALGKSVIFAGRGGELRLEAHLFEAIQAALHQCVRNAVAHGIEAEGDRSASGKPAAGSIRVEIVRRGRYVVFRCEDDGRGVDVDAVRRVALDKGLISSATGTLDAGELLRLLLRGGISTSGRVTEISGRGIGLDIVREAMERVGGEVGVRTEPGRGTTVELLVPLSLVSIEALALESAGVRITIPLDAVRRTLRMTPADIIRTAQSEAILFDGAAIPLVPLSGLLSQSAGVRRRNEKIRSAVVIETAGGIVAIGAERLIGIADVVLRPLPELAPPAPIVAGISLDAEGNPQLVLDPHNLIREAQHADPVVPAPDKPSLPILVVDDSLTTRMLEQSILESAGFEVEVATSGEEALEMARRKRFALFLVDVEMPGIDGFTFIERIRADAALRGIPAILVSSRASPDDFRRGEEAGANDYMVKSNFDQTKLLNRIRELVM
jgi:two-component system chemotaxis sensor kinase CheA